MHLVFMLETRWRAGQEVSNCGGLCINSSSWHYWAAFFIYQLLRDGLKRKSTGLAISLEMELPTPTAK